MPTFDIIVPAYNAARFLPAALDSVVAQSFPDWRILLVDDGSQDATPEIASRYKQQLGEKLLYFRQGNAGLPAARNAALRQATAPLLALLDADDVWLPCRLEATFEVFRQHPDAGLAYGFVDRIDQDGNILDVFTTRHKHAEGRIARYIYRRDINLPCPTVTFRRDCLERVGLFDESLRATEDRDLWLRIAQHFPVALVPKLIAHYRISPTSMTTDPDRMLRSQLQFVAKHYGTPDCGFWSRRVALSWIYRQRAEALSRNGRDRAALGSALRAMLFDPLQAMNARTAFSLLLTAAGIRPVRAGDQTVPGAASAADSPRGKKK